MIIYDLKCKNNHPFEGWFKDFSSFEEQKTQKLISCPVCGDVEVAMVPSTISVAKDRREQGPPRELSPMKMLQMVNDFVSKNFDDVGSQFADVALKIHRGETERRNIRGVTTDKEEEALREEGVQFVKIPVPKFDS